MENITRERLFELIWKEPATSVAQRLGISDAAVAKLCRRLQVPKPPRGYWARKRAGHRVRRPPLPAFIEASEKERASRTSHKRPMRRPPPSGPKLSPRRRELFDHAVRHLRGNSATADDFKVTESRLTWIDPDFAAAVIVAIARHYRAWGLPDDAGYRAQDALDRVAVRIIDDLLPLARDRVVVFGQPQSAQDYPASYHSHPTAVVPFPPELVRAVTRLVALARELGLAYLAHDLGTSDHFWRVRWAHNPDQWMSGRTVLCVSASHLWVRYDGPTGRFSYGPFDTETVPIETIVPLAQLGEREIDVPLATSRILEQAYSERLEALAKAEKAFEIAIKSWSDLDDSSERNRLTSALSLWWDDDEFEALHRVRDGLSNIKERLDKWEDQLERERGLLCRELLGVRPGDTVSVQSDGRPIKLQLENADLIMNENKRSVFFLLHGKRYRKDGQLGKRRETTYIRVPWRNHE